MSSHIAASPSRRQRHGRPKRVDDRLVVLGDDADGKELEVMAVEGPKGELIVIHAMELRERCISG